MQSRRDHVQAYQFVTSRLASALTTGDPGRGEPPLRRSSLGLMWGVLVAVLLCLGFAVYGLIVPGGNTDYKKAGAIVVEKETGNRYLYLEGALYPTLNTASAMLFYAGSNQTGQFTPVSRNSLVGVPHGTAVGIPGAPDSVPQAKDMVGPEWSLCAAPGATAPSLVIDIDPNTKTTGLDDNLRYLVQGPDLVNYAVWRSRIFPIASHTALVALGFGDVPPTKVPTVWIHQLDQGPTLDVPKIPDAGTNFQAGLKVGDLVRADAGGEQQTFVVRKDGVAPVNPTALALLLGQPGAAQPKQISTAELATLPESADHTLLQGTPNLVSARNFIADQAMCVLQHSRGDVVGKGELVIEPLPVYAGRTLMNVPPGKGMLAVAEPAPSQANNRTYYLITDQGEKFRVAQQAFGPLGLGNAPVGVPKEVLDAMPSGPDLVMGKAVLTANRGGGQ
jgi:type VII secretion protein EccB